jgi:hypothetical protein
MRRHRHAARRAPHAQLVGDVDTLLIVRIEEGEELLVPAI